jgi:AraC-like DNA-binding protein
VLSFYRITEPDRPISLRAPYLVYYGVVAGRKTVSADGEEAHTLHAGESLLVPPLQTVRAAFPSADQTPARWLAFKIDQNAVEMALDQVEGEAGPEKEPPWNVRERPFCHVEEREGIRRALENVAFFFREDPPHRDSLLDLSAQQLIISLLQTPAHTLLVNGLSRHSADGGLAAAVQYIQDHLDRHISIDELVDQACMSKSTFYRHFSDEFDMSPLEYITEQRVVRARHLLSSTDKTVADVSHDLGFSSTSYFIDMFKEHVGMTPKQYQLRDAEQTAIEDETV